MDFENMTSISKREMPIISSCKIGRAFLALLTIVLAVTFFSGTLSAQTSKDVALMLKTQGLVNVNRTTKTAAFSGRKGLRLHSGNIVQTGARGFASIVFTDDKSLLKVNAKSSVTIRGKRVRGRVEKTLSMRLGELWSRVTKGSFYRVETPSGVAAVKGTEFYLICTENGTIVICIEDVVEMINDFGRIDIFPGEYGFMSRGNPPQKRSAEPNEIPDWAGTGDEADGEIEIEFEDASGQKKIIKIKYQ